MKKLNFLTSRTAMFMLAGALVLYAVTPPQHSKMHVFQTSAGVLGDGSAVQGSSARLARHDNAVWLQINTTDLPEGAFTVWWVIFNNPGACVGGCGEDDLFRPAVGASVLWATGGIVGRNGVGHFRAHLEEGELPGMPGQILLPGPPLQNAEAADIHVIVRYHGLVVPSIAVKQTTTSYGGCIAGPAVPPDPDPADRLFPCFDPQFAEFPAP